MIYNLRDKQIELEEGKVYFFNKNMRLVTVRNKPMEFGGYYGECLAFKPRVYTGYILEHRRIPSIDTARWYWFNSRDLVPCLIPHEKSLKGLSKFYIQQGVEEGNSKEFWTLPKAVSTRTYRW